MKRITKTMVINLLLIFFMPMAKLSAQVSVWDGTHEPWTHGTGTEGDPFLIENAQQFAYLAYRVNNGLDAGGGHVSNHDYHYKMMIDIDLNGSEDFQWTPIGYWNSNSDYQCFGGCFNGNNHTISGMYINSYFANRDGLFGYVDGVTIENLGVIGDTIATAGTYVGGIIGVADGTSIITNCYNTGTVFAYSYSVNSYSGGIVGYAGMAVITNCYNTGIVSSNAYYSYPYSSYSCSGGIIGCADTAEITNCYNTGAVSASDYSKNSSSTSGGIVGAANTAEITNSYNTGIVSSHAYHYSRSGGIVGAKDNGTVTNSYFLNTCGGNNNHGGQPMSADAMQTQEFVDLLNNGCCAWEYDYNSTNSGYPVLNGVVFSAFTKPATNIAATTATLNGSIIVENTNVITKGFEYRATGTSSFTTINVSGNSNDFSYNFIAVH